MQRQILFALILCLGFIACQSGPGTKAKAQPSDLYASATELMEAYDSSFRSLFYRHVSRTGDDFEQLALLYNFYMNYSIWARVMNDGNLVSISKGRSNLILAAYEPGHPYLKEPGPTLITHRGENIEIHMRPQRISKDIAGIFLVHELSHVMDFINNTAVEEFEVNETKAYFHEKKAANIAYDGALDKGLDKVLAILKPGDVGDLISIRQTPEGRLRLQELLIDIEKTMRIEPPQSEADAEMRLGFYTVALEIRRQENANAGKKRYSILASKVGDLLRAASKY